MKSLPANPKPHFEIIKNKNVHKTPETKYTEDDIDELIKIVKEAKKIREEAAKNRDEYHY